MSLFAIEKIIEVEIKKFSHFSATWGKNFSLLVTIDEKLLKTIEMFENYYSSFACENYA